MSKETDIIKPPDKSEGGTLAGLWKNILKDNNMLNKDTVKYLSDRYVKNTNILKSKVKNVNRKTRGSILNNITATDMTWKVFLDLVFNVLNVVKVTVSIKLTHANGDETVHSITINDTSKKHTGDKKDEG